jgi:hypothetical protein
MEIADVRKRILSTIERARQRAADRRARSDEAGRAYSTFLETTATPLFRQVANVLRAEGHQFSVSTPSGSVRLMSDRTAEDYIELLLDTTGDAPHVTGHTSRSRGRRVIETERAIGDPARLDENAILDFLTRELEAFVDR